MIPFAILLLCYFRFLRDYDEMFPLADDVSLLQQASSALDETRTSYILQAVESAWDKTGRRRKTAQDPPISESTSGTVTLPGASERTEQFEELDNLEVSCLEQSISLQERWMLGYADPPPYGTPSHRLPFRDLFCIPKTAVCFLKDSCLVFLEKKGFCCCFSSSFFFFKKSLSARPVKPDPTPLVTSRCNVFQDDEFDVFSKDAVDVSRIQKGKRYRNPDPKMQPSEIHPTTDFQLSRPQDFRPILTFRMAPLSQTVKRSRSFPWTLEGEEPQSFSMFFLFLCEQDHFVQDPAVLRERAEARRATFLARKGQKPDTSAAVTGAAKGRGQSRETVQERRKKEASKGARANHNRRAMADRKRNKGMIPS
ncbi:PREDICTED: activating signal cointegrator 1 complex subunit 2 [Thamnophis sirtalis]|uniref:Activating signal cointegrator 1 complex subunit 2 n=1 Tax=Thamnophis sirtalis TaxID=35019 RepID=A0A6I9YYL5_9SAUR|nr:PREDICTED: activating signal cointegrator 1 complex subunit 2 [Thamnophis sirtalis]